MCVGRYRLSDHRMRLIFMCCINFCYNTYFSYRKRPDGAVPFLQHVQPPGVTERGLDLAQEEVGGHGVTADALDGDAQFGPAARLRLSSRRRDSAEVMPPGSLPMALSFNHEWNGTSSFDS